ncbi:peptidoglycan recognition protein 1-like [Macrosteles quadrilineatus]|uniref:peptidoglycan recognition protein 1-like n=1 Tax=Macrosteles quadrilineatus TaxID=74068 RepID=UPI0023E0A9EF|nr:peptidoglycan recognition protein 1-like [Macrosteles quadrilineatus]
MEEDQETKEGVVKIIRPEGELEESTEFLVSEEFDHLVKKLHPEKTLPPSLVTREKWGAVPPKYREPLCTPAKFVYIMDTRSEFCTCEESCSIVLKKLQHHYMEEKGLPDIPWNFLIGEDGRVYEGRGWVTNPSKVLPETQEYDCRSLDIAYIGNYQAKLPSHEMTMTMDKLVVIGQEKNIIDWEYEYKSELLNDFVEPPLESKP